MLAWSRRGRDPQRAFQLTSLTAWTGFTVGWLLVHGSVWEDVVGVTLSFAVGSSAIGGMVTMLRARRAGPASGSPPSTAGARENSRPSVVRTVARVMHRISGRFTALHWGMPAAPA